ncbi:hypothetical protein BROC_02029 [Candidatus Brocadiaceae bacterium]|nr:hypothetical protein BROC_02029 [Candidatus Brocadiaceae bacterium]
MLVTAQTLTYKYGIKKQKIDSLDAIHLALVLELSARYQKPVTIITSDNGMIEICQQEGISILNPVNP